MDTLILSRLQFAANMSFHILFPTITIALCWLLVFFRFRHAATRGTPSATGPLSLIRKGTPASGPSG